MHDSVETTVSVQYATVILASRNRSDFSAKTLRAVRNLRLPLRGFLGAGPLRGLVACYLGKYTYAEYTVSQSRLCAY